MNSFSNHRIQGDKLSGIFLLKKPQILLLDLEIIKHVLVTNFKNFSDNSISYQVDLKMDPIFGGCPENLQGKDWKKLRATILPAFTPARVLYYNLKCYPCNNSFNFIFQISIMFNLIENISHKLVRYIHFVLDKGDQKPIETKKLLNKYCIDVSSSCTFAVDGESFTKRSSEIRKMTEDMFHQKYKYDIYNFIGSNFPILTTIYRRSFFNKKLEEFFIKMNDYSIKYKIENLIQQADYLQYIVQLKDKNRIELLADQIQFYMKSIDVCGKVLVNIINELAKNTEIQTKLREEIKRFHTNIIDMPYLDQVYNESLRINPPICFITRRCNKSIEFDDIKIEESMDVIVPIYSIHHDSKYYLNPEEFYPERFKSGVNSFKEMGVFIPFGDGPRVCLGSNFASAHIKAGIVEIIKNFEISINEEASTVKDCFINYVPV